MIVVGSLILLAGVDQPFLLVVISSSIAGVQMFIYSGLLIMLNRKALPKQLRIGGVRLAVLAVSFLFFGFLSVLLVVDRLGLTGDPLAQTVVAAGVGGDDDLDRPRRPDVGDRHHRLTAISGSSSGLFSASVQ